MKHIQIGLLIVMLSLGSIWGAADEAAMEQSMSDRAQRVLDGVFGRGNLIPVVDIMISDPSFAVKYTRQSQAVAATQKNNSGDKMQILPGYPVIRNLAPENYKQLPFDSVTSYSRPAVRQINVIVIANQNFPKGQFPKVQLLLGQILGLKTGRDRVDFSVQKFMADRTDKGASVFTRVAGDDSKDSGGSGNGSILSGVGLFMMGILMAVFMGLYYWLQRKNQLMLASILQKQSSPAKGGGLSGMDNASITLSAPSMPAAAKAPPQSTTGEMRLSDDKMKRYFDFVTDSTIDKLLFILKREKVALENLAVLVPCLLPHLGARVLQELDGGSRASIALNMLDPKMFNKALIEKFEAQLKSAMECLIGGEGMTQDMIGYLSESNRKEVLMTLNQSNPEGYRRIRPLVLVFDDLARLDDKELKLVVDSVGRDVLFTALVGSDPQTVQRFNDNFAQGQRNMLREFMDLRAASFHPSVIEANREQVLGVVMQLESESKIALRPKL